MTNDKLNKIIGEFYNLKSELTSGDVTIKRCYLLFKKYLILLVMYERYSNDTFKEEKNNVQKKSKQLIIKLIITSLVTILNPIFGLIGLLYCFLEFKDFKKYVLDINDFSTTVKENDILIQNLGEILTCKIMNNTISLLEDEFERLEQDTDNEVVESILNSEMRQILAEEFQATGETIGEIEEKIHKRERVLVLPIFD